MLFSSYVFLFVFLPLVLGGYLLLCRFAGRRVVVAWFIATSVVFYGYWNAKYLALLLISIGANYALGARIRLLAGGEGQRGVNRTVALGVAGNLLVLGYYKYSAFLVVTTNHVLGTSLAVPQILLPLAISFFTFQQIAYLLDQARSGRQVGGLLEYAAFVLFFPHLIAGPIVNHGEMIPQFADDSIRRARARNLALGITIFGLGLFKKVVLADRIAVFVAPVFDAAKAGSEITFIEGWGGALAYLFQLYFDFSGYSDMAIGLGALFGVRLPQNFDSPFKALNIIDFWRRWHMTLTRFLTTYLYNPMTLRLTRAEARRQGKPVSRSRMTPRTFFVLIAVPTMVTMTLAGIWHGAGYTFIVFGVLHGAYLVINHAWRALRLRGWQGGGRLRRFASWGVTFGAVVVSFVIFRAESLTAAGRIIASMAGWNGFALPTSYLGLLNRLGGMGDVLASLGVDFRRVYLYEGAEQLLPLVGMLLVVALGPNVRELVPEEPDAGTAGSSGLQRWRWTPTFRWSVAVGVVLALSVCSLTRVSEFLYFQF